MAKGFFTDTTLCIGCKACEVACKQWNQLPADGYRLTGMSYDNTVGLGATTWRHVAFVEQLGGRGAADGHAASQGQGASAIGARIGQGAPGVLSALADHTANGANGGRDGRSAATLQAPRLVDDATGGFLGENRWLMMSDVCKHCQNAGCLEACPTGAIIRNEFGDVYVQPDICNGCAYCVIACPFGVIDIQEEDGRAWKCTLCYDRQKDGLTPACAKACPTQSIQFGELDDLRERARERVGALHERGVTDAYLYGVDENTSVGDLNAFFLLVDKPEVYNLPPDPVAPSKSVGQGWRAMTVAGLGMVVAAAFSVLITRGQR